MQLRAFAMIRAVVVFTDTANAGQDKRMSEPTGFNGIGKVLRTIASWPISSAKSTGRYFSCQYFCNGCLCRYYPALNYLSLAQMNHSWNDYKISAAGLL